MGPDLAVGHELALAGAAKNFLASLAPEQREGATFTLADEERFFWHYVPTQSIEQTLKRSRKGLTLGELQPHQKHLASALL